jgi:hypothetical protein
VRDRVLRERMLALMMAVPPKSIKEISDGLGFATAQSFARWLKREDGIVPHALRAEVYRRLEARDGRESEHPNAPGEAPSGKQLARRRRADARRTTCPAPRAR